MRQTLSSDTYTGRVNPSIAPLQLMHLRKGSVEKRRRIMPKEIARLLKRNVPRWRRAYKVI